MYCDLENKCKEQCEYCKDIEHKIKEKHSFLKKKKKFNYVQDEEDVTTDNKQEE